MFYCIVKANNEYSKSRLEFVKEISNDENEGCVELFSKYLVKLSTKEEEVEDKKKVKKGLK